MLTLGVALASGQPAEAASFNVTNLNDSGGGSLREAIIDANSLAGADVVTFQPGLTGTITLTTGQLDVVDSVDIQGPGAAVLTVSGNNSSRVFYLYNSAALLDITISGLTVTGGSASLGGGIVDFDENLTLDGMTITNNAAIDGGGLWADGANLNLTVSDSIISGNTASSVGGGIYVGDTGGPLLIQNTDISGNDAGGRGGGIYFYDPDDDTTIEGSTISGNSAGNAGGGIAFYNPDGGTHTISETTISGNDAGSGGGLFFYTMDQPFVIENCTISGNQATLGEGGGAYFYDGEVTIRHTTVAGNSAAASGGGLFTAYASVPLDHTIVGDNTAPLNPDLCGGGTFDASFSLVEITGTANVNDNGGNVFGQDPELGPLQNNGGPTETHLPAGTSPAVDAGDPAFTPPPATDQRGFNRVVGTAIDMGAVELNAGTIQLTVSAASVNENGGTITITATRIGGTGGAVSVDYSTSDGTATDPADFLDAAGTLNWADGDGAPKSFQVTIVNDPDDEPDETFSATISNPQGGATLGSPATEVVTILDDDLPGGAIQEIPTLDEYGKLLFMTLFGLGGFLLLRRRKGFAAPMLAVSLTLGAAGALHAEKGGEIRAATLAQIQTRGDSVIIRLADGTSYEVSSEDFRLSDRRKGHRAQNTPRLETLPANQPMVLKVRRGRDGKVKRIKIELMDTPAKAQAAVRAETE